MSGKARKPKVYIHPREYARLWSYVELARETPQGAAQEISGMGIVEPWGQDFFIPKVFIVKQECSGGHTDFDEENVDEVMRDLIREGRGDEIPKTRLWWHSHATMQVFFSSIDVGTIDTLTKNLGWMLAACLNTQGKYVLELDYMLPTGQQVTVDELEFDPWYFLSEQETEEVKGDIANLVSFRRPVSSSSYEPPPVITKTKEDPKDNRNDKRVWSSVVQGWVRDWQLSSVEVAWKAGWRPDMKGTLYEWAKEHGINVHVGSNRPADVWHLHGSAQVDGGSMSHMHPRGGEVHSAPTAYPEYIIWSPNMAALVAYREQHKNDPAEAEVLPLPTHEPEVPDAEDEPLRVLLENNVEYLGFGLYRQKDTGRLYLQDRSLLPYVREAVDRHDALMLDPTPGRNPLDWGDVASGCCLGDPDQADYFGSRYCCSASDGHRHTAKAEGPDYIPPDAKVGRVTKMGDLVDAPREFSLAQVKEAENQLLSLITTYIEAMDLTRAEDLAELEEVADEEDLTLLEAGAMTLGQYLERFLPVLAEQDPTGGEQE